MIVKTRLRLAATSTLAAQLRQLADTCGPSPSIPAATPTRPTRQQQEHHEHQQLGISDTDNNPDAIKTVLDDWMTKLQYLLDGDCGFSGPRVRLRPPFVPKFPGVRWRQQRAELLWAPLPLIRSQAAQVTWHIKALLNQESLHGVISKHCFIATGESFVTKE